MDVHTYRREPIYMNETIECLYSCSACSLLNVPVKVPARTTEDVVLWVGQILGAAIGADHSRRSPHCTSKKMDNVKIPMAGAEKVGGSPVN